ncbi:Cuticlin-1 [Orchesella cincta]|uniref:Cuticlin-1 n=1 Tax=Orchesella cincta TaxID=48709 RepID=A0A1D2ND60_ORCCI|nr:Cuticlin-1 [Orchesella cincta]
MRLDSHYTFPLGLICLACLMPILDAQRPSVLSGGGLRPLLGLTLRQQLQAGQPPVPRFDCSPESTGFELVTGFVFSSPADLLDSQPGTLMLADCLEACRLNSSCRAANYETGLCVLFSADSDHRPGALSSSQFPVFTLYAQKVCLSGHCDRAWDYERVPDFKLKARGQELMKKQRKTGSRTACMELCLSERDFVCRSATYSKDTGDCSLSDMDRMSLGALNAIESENGTDYMESNCVSDPTKLCDFKPLDGKILKTVDAVYQEVATEQDCKNLCLNTAFRCQSYDYNATGAQVCRLSHHNTLTLSQIREPFLAVPDASTKELSACYNVSVDCRAGDMIATVRTSKIFQGKLYAKGAPNSCALDVQNSLEFALRLPYTDLECGVQREAMGRYSTEVILQHHDQIVTASDMGLSVACQYDLTNKSVSNEVDLGVSPDLKHSITQESIVDSPNVAMRVTDRRGESTGSAQVGDPLSLRFEIVDPNSPYDIFVRELIAMDGVDGSEIMLLDGEGCPTDQRIMGALNRASDDQKALVAHFDAFKFPTSEIVQFRALVTPCLPTCQPVICPVVDGTGLFQEIPSLGRRKRRMLNATYEESISNELDDFHSPYFTISTLNDRRFRRDLGAERNEVLPQEEMLLVRSIHISDRFGADKKRDRKLSQDTDFHDNDYKRHRSQQSFEDDEVETPTTESRPVDQQRSATCINLSTVLGAGAVVVGVQIALLIIGAMLFLRKRDASKKLLPQQAPRPSPQQTIFVKRY